MPQGFGLEDMMGSVSAVSFVREDLERLMEEPMIASMSQIIELELNTTPLTEKGLELTEQLKELLEDKQIINFRLNKGRKWFALSADERAEFVYKLLTTEHELVADVD